MTSRHKEQLKAVKGQDPVQAILTNSLEWLLKNTRIVMMATVPLVIAVAGYFGFRYYQDHERDTRVEELGKIQVVFDGEQTKANDARQAIQKKIEALETAEQARSAAKPGEKPAAAPATPDPKVAAEKEALQKQADAVKADHHASREQFEAFAKKYDKTPEGWSAAMNAAKLYLEDDNFQAARPLLEGVLAKSKESPIYQAQGRFELIGVLEELGDYDAALKETDALEKIADKDMQPKILLTRGRLQMLKNAKDEAKATFAKLIEAHGTTPEAQKARSIQSLLN